MAKLTAAERKRLPKKDFGLPGKVDKGGENKAGRGAYPMPDKAHAASAKAYASKEEARGKLSKSAEEKIDAKANKVLDEGRKKRKPDPVKVERSRSTM
jgi:hypothetical protein